MWQKRNVRKTGGSDRSRAVAKLDRVFSQYIRLRDSFLTPVGVFFRCISCGRILPYEQSDCGHYVNRAHMATRFDEDNCHAQCRQCNRFDEGNIYSYRNGLVAKIGLQRVLLIEAKKKNVCKLTAVELDLLCGEYRKLVVKEKERLKLK